MSLGNHTWGSRRCRTSGARPRISFEFLTAFGSPASKGFPISLGDTMEEKPSLSEGTTLLAAGFLFHGTSRIQSRKFIQRFEGAFLGTQPGKIPPQEVSACQEHSGQCKLTFTSWARPALQNHFVFENLRNCLFIAPLSHTPSHEPSLQTQADGNADHQVHTIMAEISQGCSAGLQAAEILLGAQLLHQSRTSPRWDGRSTEEQEREGRNPSVLLGWHGCYQLQAQERHGWEKKSKTYTYIHKHTCEVGAAWLQFPDVTQTSRGCHELVTRTAGDSDNCKDDSKAHSLSSEWCLQVHGPSVLSV